MTERVGIVGESIETIAETVEAAGGKALVDDPRADPAFVITVGESALYSLVPNPPAPVLPVDAGPGIGSIDPDDAQEVIPELLDESRSLPQSESKSESKSKSESQSPSQSLSRSESYPTISHPILSVNRGSAIEQDDADLEESENNGDERVYALADVTLVTAEPARISEYTIASSDERVTSVRADGVVVATPAGSYGYAHDAGGPRIAPETGVGAVVPIAPFSITGDHWVLSLSDIRLTVERDDAPVDLFVDGRRVGTVSPEDTVSLTPVSTLKTIRGHKRGLERL
jgi:NAD+ kinase